MSPIFQYICQCGHTTEPLQKVHSDEYRCEKCPKYAKFTVSVPGYRRDHTINGGNDA